MDHGQKHAPEQAQTQQFPDTACAERRRLEQDERRERNWKRWGPYLAERQWGTVREDYSEGGSSWDDLSHDQARRRAYRWGEDGCSGAAIGKRAWVLRWRCGMAGIPS